MVVVLRDFLFKKDQQNWYVGFSIPIFGLWLKKNLIAPMYL